MFIVNIINFFIQSFEKIKIDSKKKKWKIIMNKWIQIIQIFLFNMSIVNNINYVISTIFSKT